MLAANAESYVYIYGVARAATGGTPEAAIEGVLPGASVEVVGVGGLAAIISRVPAAAFASAASKGIEDPEWVTERVIAHHRVLDAFARRGALAPMKFGSVRRSLDDIAQLFAENAPLFERALNRVEGAREWGVKLYGDAEACAAFSASTAAAASTLGALQAELDAASPGKAFFIRRRLRESMDAEARSGLHAHAVRVHGALGDQAREAALVRGAQKETGANGRATSPVLNAAYLVEIDAEAQFLQAINDIRQSLPPDCFTLKLTGPWPPYNFVDLTTEGQGA
jgi:hypothetical protein